MVKSSHHQDYDSSSYRGVLRSKHSETEQRRRTKINHRFQMLRDLIPQHDHKSDKASFLLQVIHYIHFLHERLQIYHPYPLQPSNLLPWKNHQAPAESMVDRSQIMKNGSVYDGSEILTNVPNILECEFDATAMYKTLEQLSGSTNRMIPFNVPTQSNVFTTIERAGMPAESFQESVADAANMAYQLQSQQWQVRQCATECAAAKNTEKRLTNETGSSSVSNAYSQGVLNILTDSLQSAGVDLSQTSISVEIDVGRHGNGGADAGASSSKDEKRDLGNQDMEEGGDVGESDEAYERMRSESS